MGMCFVSPLRASAPCASPEPVGPTRVACPLMISDWAQVTRQAHDLSYGPGCAQATYGESYGYNDDGEGGVGPNFPSKWVHGNDLYEDFYGYNGYGGNRNTDWLAATGNPWFDWSTWFWFCNEFHDELYSYGWEEDSRKQPGCPVDMVYSDVPSRGYVINNATCPIVLPNHYGVPKDRQLTLTTGPGTEIKNDWEFARKIGGVSSMSWYTWNQIYLKYVSHLYPTFGYGIAGLSPHIQFYSASGREGGPFGDVDNLATGQPGNFSSILCDEGVPEGSPCGSSNPLLGAQGHCSYSILSTDTDRAACVGCNVYDGSNMCKNMADFRPGALLSDSAHNC